MLIGELVLVLYPWFVELFVSIICISCVLKLYSFSGHSHWVDNTFRNMIAKCKLYTVARTSRFLVRNLYGGKSYLILIAQGQREMGYALAAGKRNIVTY